MPESGLKKILLKFNYPQRVFGNEALNYIRENLENTKLIIDCPCGNGETTWHLSKIKNARIVAADISAESIQRAKTYYSASNIEFSCKDIKDCIQGIENKSVFCLINSLFLFPNAAEILTELQPQIKRTKSELILIVPNTKGRNFIWFQKNNPGENKLILDHEQLKPFFEDMNFKVDLLKPICYTHHFNRKDIRFFSIFWALYLNCLNKLQTAFKIGKANYFFIALSA